jgi:hypothetical protein
MLLRKDDRGVLAIGQPSHAWVSGQLARAWGNERFGAVHPREEVCLAAEQHDIGMAGWDLEPSFNPQTGLPHGFVEMPLDVHLGLWSAAAPRVLRQSRYAAMLISMHGVRLYELRDLAKMDPAGADTIRSFFTAQRAFQAELVASMRADPATAPFATDELIQRASDLLWTWDGFSLALCLGWAPWGAKHVPVAGDGPGVEVRLTPILAATGPIEVDPWPFAADRVSVQCEGQRLPAGGYANASELRAGLGAARWETLTIELLPPARSA